MARKAGVLAEQRRAQTKLLRVSAVPARLDSDGGEHRRYRAYCNPSRRPLGAAVAQGGSERPLRIFQHHRICADARRVGAPVAVDRYYDHPPPSGWHNTRAVLGVAGSPGGQSPRRCAGSDQTESCSRSVWLAIRASPIFKLSAPAVTRSVGIVACHDSSTGERR